MNPIVYVVGFFPPPVHGQSMGTLRLAELLSAHYEVRRVDLAQGASDLLTTDKDRNPRKLLHYWRVGRQARTALQSAPAAPILWAAASPNLLGHGRDVFTVLPAFPAAHPLYVVIHRGTFDRLFRHPLTRWTTRRLVHRTQGFIFLNPDLSEACARWIPKAKRFVIPNTIDQELVFTDAEVRASQTDRSHRTTLRVLFLSNMMPEKGYLDALQAVRLLHARAIPVQADFVGRWFSDTDRRVFMRQLLRAGLETVVTHHGAVTDRRRIRRFYAEADVFLLPTFHPTEAQPITLLEAMNAGLPIVTTRTGGIPALVRAGQEALFVAPHDPADIARQLQQLTCPDTWLAFSTAARQRFLSCYSPEAVRQQWESLLALQTLNTA